MFSDGCKTEFGTKVSPLSMLYKTRPKGAPEGSELEIAKSYELNFVNLKFNFTNKLQFRKINLENMFCLKF